MVKLEHCKKIITIGAGFIGVEISDELKKMGKEVTLVEVLPHILRLAFDEELALEAEDILKSRGVNILTGVGVKEIIGNKKVTGVLLNNGEKLDADAVVLSMGYFPNTALAEKSGIKLNEKGFIKVDEYMRTENPDIFAVGDCAEKINSITKKVTNELLSPTACAEGKTAGLNLYKLHSELPSNGNILNYYTTIENVGFGIAGLNEKTDIESGFNIKSEIYTGIIKRSINSKNLNKQFIKLVADRDSGRLLGCEILNGTKTEEIINLIRVAIENKLTINSIIRHLQKEEINVAIKK